MTQYQYLRLPHHELVTHYQYLRFQHHDPGFMYQSRGTVAYFLLRNSPMYVLIFMVPSLIFWTSGPALSCILRRIPTQIVTFWTYWTCSILYKCCVLICWHLFELLLLGKVLFSPRIIFFNCHGCLTFILSEINCYLSPLKNWHNNSFLGSVI